MVSKRCITGQGLLGVIDSANFQLVLFVLETLSDHTRVSHDIVLYLFILDYFCLEFFVQLLLLCTREEPADKDKTLHCQDEGDN